jgi:hypothetical protein
MSNRLPILLAAGRTAAPSSPPNSTWSAGATSTSYAGLIPRGQICIQRGHGIPPPRHRRYNSTRLTRTGALI